MLRERLIKWLLFFLASIFLLSSPFGGFSEAIISFVHFVDEQTGKSYFTIVVLALCFAIVAWLGAFVRDSIVEFLYRRLDGWFLRRGIGALRLKKVGRVMRLARLHRKLLEFLEFTYGGFRYSKYDSSMVMSGISQKTMLQYVRDLGDIFVSFGTVTCLACAYYLYNIQMCDAKCYIAKIQNVLNGDLKIVDVVKFGFVNLSTVATFVSLISMCLYSYFRGRKWVVRKIVRNDGSDSFEQAILEYEKLCRWIRCNINLFADHFDRLISFSKDIVRRAVEAKCSPSETEYESPDLQSWRNVKLDTDRISSLGELAKIVGALEGGRVVWYARLFATSEYANVGLRRSDFHKMKSADAMKKMLLSVDAVDELLSNRLSRSETVCDQDMQKLQEDCEIELARHIYFGLLFLMRLKEAGDALESYLYPSNIERYMHERLIGDVL